VVASDPVSLTEENKAEIDAHLMCLKEMADLYCSGCGYCLPCPQEVNIPEIFRLYNMGRVYGLWQNVRGSYRGLRRKAPERGMPADACVECGVCEEKCPQQLPIRDQLKEAHAALIADEEAAKV